MTRAACPRADRWLLATVRWWRPVSGWVCVIGLADILIVQPHMGIVISDERTWAHLGIIALCLGLRSYDKMRGTSVDTATPAPITEG